MELVFTPHGSVELVDEKDSVVWSSDDDAEFKDEFNDEFLNAERDGEKVIDFLVDCNVLSEDDAETLDIVEESLDDAANDE